MTVPDPRSLIAAVLGIGLGLLVVRYPDAVIRLHTVGRLPPDRGGGYGSDGSAPDRWRWAVRAAGVVFVGAGLYFGATALVSG